MFRFEDPIYLWLLLVIPLLAMLHLWTYRNRKNNLASFGQVTLIKRLMPEYSKYRPIIKFWLLQSVLALLIIALARPQMGLKVSKEKRNGIEAIIALDISNSMLAQDVIPSRLEKSKMMIENLIDNFNNDKIGLIVFAGDAFVQLPVTTDYVSAKMFLQTIDPNLIQTQGTNIAEAINLATNSFTQQEKIGKAIIVITDGEDHEGGAIDAAKKAKDKGYKVFMLGIGDPKGALIQTENGQILKDENGLPVRTCLNEQMCKDIAQAGNGTYIHVDNTGDAQKYLNQELDKLEKGKLDSVIYSDYDEQFQAVAIIVLLLLIIETFILETKQPITKFFNLHVRTLFIILFCFLSIYGAFAQNDRNNIRHGNKLYRKHIYIQAEINYRKALKQNQQNTQAIYNLGCALMQQKKDSLAISYYEKAGKQEKSKKRKALAYHNIGVVCQMHKLYTEAIQAYKESLRNNPNDNETRYNLALCKKLEKKQKQNNKQKNKQNNKNDKQNKANKQNKDKTNKQNHKKENKKQLQEQMSKENAEQLLNAAMQQEQNTQQRLKKAMQQPKQHKLIKNW